MIVCGCGCRKKEGERKCQRERKWYQERERVAGMLEGCCESLRVLKNENGRTRTRTREPERERERQGESENERDDDGGACSREGREPLCVNACGST